MKKKELERKLKKLGWWLKGQGGDHEIWTNGDAIETVPRHNEVNEFTATIGEVHMVFDGKIWRDGKWWVVFIPALELSTQGTSRKDALRMAEDAVGALVEKKGFSAHASLIKSHGDEDYFILSADDEAALVALFLRRQRAASKLSIREIARRLGYKSPSAYAQYETGKHIPGIDKLARFLHAMNPRFQVTLGLVAA